MRAFEELAEDATRAQLDYRTYERLMCKTFILAVLRKHNWNQTTAARELGLHRNWLVRKIRTLRIQCPNARGSRNSTSAQSTFAAGAGLSL